MAERSRRTEAPEKQELQVERMLYRPREAAKAMGVSVSRMYQLINSGVVPSVRLGNTIRVPVQGLRKLAQGKDR